MIVKYLVNKKGRMFEELRLCRKKTLFKCMINVSIRKHDLYVRQKLRI